MSKLDQENNLDDAISQLLKTAMEQVAGLESIYGEEFANGVRVGFLGSLAGQIIFDWTAPVPGKDSPQDRQDLLNQVLDLVEDNVVNGSNAAIRERGVNLECYCDLDLESDNEAAAA